MRGDVRCRSGREAVAAWLVAVLAHLLGLRQPDEAVPDCAGGAVQRPRDGGRPVRAAVGVLLQEGQDEPIELPRLQMLASRLRLGVAAASASRSSPPAQRTPARSGRAGGGPRRARPRCGGPHPRSPAARAPCSRSTGRRRRRPPPRPRSLQVGGQGLQDRLLGGGLLGGLLLLLIANLL